jgi:hypothetical protein
MRITPDDAASGQARSIPSLRVHINQSAGWKAWCRAHVAEGSRQGSEEARAFISEGVTVWNLPHTSSSAAGLSPCYVRRTCIVSSALARVLTIMHVYQVLRSSIGALFGRHVALGHPCYLITGLNSGGAC